MKPLNATKPLTWICSMLAWCSTLIFLAGVAGLQYGCNAGYASPTLQSTSGATIAAFGMSSTFGTCSIVLRFYWFTFAFVTVALIALMSATISRWGLHYARNFVSCLVTICVVLMMIASEAFTGYETVYGSLGLSGSWWHALFRTACAGAIMAVVFLMLLLMAVGTDWEKNTGENMWGSELRPGAPYPGAPSIWW